MDKLATRTKLLVKKTQLKTPTTYPLSHTAAQLPYCTSTTAAKRKTTGQSILSLLNLKAVKKSKQ